MSAWPAARWRERLVQFAPRAQQAPERPREPLRLADGRRIGSVDPTQVAVPARRDGWLVPSDHGGWALAHGAQGPDEVLHRAALALRDAGLAGRWRDERLDVTTDAGETVGAIERAAVRPLGIMTFAVHLIGRHPDGRTWVQQRALDKATDPGRWDTLMGGLRATGESIVDTLARETWEEAGLRLEDLRELKALGRFTMRRPVQEGYLVEHLDVFEAVVPEHLTPVNQDGEVACFACLDHEEVDARLAADAFTLEAALALCGAPVPVDGR